MKNLLKLEEIFMFALSIFLFTKLDFAWWWYPVLIFTPDLSMIGYIVSPQIGAATYNFIHHKAVGISVFVMGMMLSRFISTYASGHNRQSISMHQPKRVTIES